MKNFLADYTDYHEFEYWFSTTPLKEMVHQDDRSGKGHIHHSHIRILDQMKALNIAEKKPFYKNPVKANLFKEIFRSIMPRSRFDDDYPRVALVALITEVVLFRDHFFQLLSRILQIVKKECPQFDTTPYSDLQEFKHEVDNKLVATIYDAIQEQLFKYVQEKRGHRDHRHESKKKHINKPSSFIFVMLLSYSQNLICLY